MTEKITVSWDDLNTRKVDTRLKEEAALARNRAYAKLEADQVTPQPSAAASASSRGGNLFYNAAVYMAVFGLLGGLLAWVVAQVVTFKPSPKAEAVRLLKEIEQVRTIRERGRDMSDAEIGATIREMKRFGQRNPYFAIAVDPTLSPEGVDHRWRQLDHDQAVRVYVSNVLAYGACGLLIAVFLGIAEPATDRNLGGVLVNGSVAAAMGLLGGVVVSLFVDKLLERLGGQIVATGPLASRQVLARAVTWGVMGLFLTIGTGLVMRSAKKFAIGLAGGLIGGLIGGAIYDPIALAIGRPELGKLIGLCAIGVVAGLATGLIENAAKAGWVRVISGLIAGKQFILYRNPTFIGSGPDCQIYLFKDNKVGRRHAAIHIVPGGFELEDLPLGATTVINGKPAKRARLRHGDRISIGATTVLFQEKKPTTVV
jgi:hypothetical protein